MKFNKFKSLAVIAFILGASFAVAEPDKQVPFGPVQNQPSFGNLSFTDYMRNVSEGRRYSPTGQLIDSVQSAGEYWTGYGRPIGITQWSGDTSLFSHSSTDVASTQSCDQVRPDSLTQAAADLNWGQCLDGRLSYTKDNKPETERLFKDMEICKCLREWPKMEAVREVMKGRAKDLLAKEARQSEQETIMNGMAFQSFALIKIPQLTNLYAHNLLDQGEAKTELGFDPVKRMHMLQDNQRISADVCISPREFMMTQQIPNAIVKASLKEPFSPANWDYKVLQRRYAEIMMKSSTDRKALEGEILTLKEKLKFLNRNPLIKYSFGAALTEQGAKGIKEKLYEALQGLANSDCNSIVRQCFKRYEDQAATVLSFDPLRVAIRAEARNDIKERADRRQEKKELAQGRTEFTQASVVKDFLDSYPNLKNPDTCEKDSLNGIECLDIYSGYCSVLDKYGPRVSALPSSDIPHTIYDDLDEYLKDDFNTDIATNEEYRKKNDEMCGARSIARGPFNWTRSSFKQYVEKVCANKSASPCPENGQFRSYEDMKEIRLAFFKEYKPGKPEDDSQRMIPGMKMNFRNATSIANEDFLETLTSQEGIPQMKTSDAQTSVASTQEVKDEKTLSAAFEQAMAGADNPLNRNIGGAVAAGSEVDSAKSADKPFLTSWGQAVANTMGATTQATGPGYNYDDIGMNYGSYIAPSTAGTQAVADVPKVENMTPDQRQDMLSDWQKDYDSWRKEKGDQLSSSESAKDSALRQEIATLRSLLSQQQQISEQQFKMLNDAIAAKSKSEPASATPRAEDRTDTRRTSPFASSGASRSIASTATTAEETDPARAPAATKDPKFNTAGAAGGASSIVSSKRGSSVDSSSDSVAREEAKLVNLRRFSDGSITIESSGPSTTGPSAGNAISVPVSDEQYRMLQANPTSLNLNQIERNIPKDQIARLEQTGEIIILLRNGSNPPFEVKVEKKDNKLVYRLKDSDGKEQAPVRRVFTRQALELQLKAEK